MVKKSKDSWIEEILSRFISIFTIEFNEIKKKIKKMNILEIEPKKYLKKNKIIYFPENLTKQSFGNLHSNIKQILC